MDFSEDCQSYTSTSLFCGSRLRTWKGGSHLHSWINLAFQAGHESAGEAKLILGAGIKAVTMSKELTRRLVAILHNKLFALSNGTLATMIIPSKHTSQKHGTFSKRIHAISMSNYLMNGLAIVITLTLIRHGGTDPHLMDMVRFTLLTTQC